MAKIVTLQILVDEDDEARIADGLNDMLRTAATPVDPDDADARSWIIDWRLGYAGGSLMLQDVPAEIDDAICNDTYSEGEAFPGQSAPLLPGFEYSLSVSAPAAMDSLWITVPSCRPQDEGSDLSVLLKRTDEGLIVDVWPAGGENGELIASIGVEFSDAVTDPVPHGSSAPIPATLVCLPSADGACYDRYAALPHGLPVLPAIAAANRVIYDVNLADRESDGLDSDSVEAAVRRGLEAIGFQFLPVERTIDWDGFHDTPPVLTDDAAALYARAPNLIPFVIYSPNESATSDGAGFWSNKDGWTALEGADRFFYAESQLRNLRLPVAVGGDAAWVPLDRISANQGAVG